MSSPNNGRVSLAPEARREGAHVVGMQRRRLLLATRELLANGGIENASVGRISKQAGISRRTFYEVFADREACFLAAFNEAIEQISQDILPAYMHERKWSARIRAGLTALLEHLDTHPGVARMCIIETLKSGPDLLERRKHVLERLAAAVGKGREEFTQIGEPLPLAAEGVVGGALSVVQARLLEGDSSLVELVNPLMGMIVHPYLGQAAARRELDRPLPEVSGTAGGDTNYPFQDLSIRFTYRTARVLAAIATDIGASNRRIADRAGVGDEGQMSRLLQRLQRVGLVENQGGGQPTGEPNAWQLTERGKAVHLTLAGKSAQVQ